jgi:hypothetical protein
LNGHIDSAEAEMLKQKNRYEQSVKERNAAGVQLLDRNDEICILYERINIQKEVLAKGEELLLEKEDEIRRLNIILNDLNRTVLLEKQKKPKLIQNEDLVKKLEDENRQLDKVLVKLGNEMENSDDPKRRRNLGGADLPQESLNKRIRKLEAYLASQEV